MTEPRRDRELWPLLLLLLLLGFGLAGGEAGQKAWPDHGVRTWKITVRPVDRIEVSLAGGKPVTVTSPATLIGHMERSWGARDNVEIIIITATAATATAIIDGIRERFDNPPMSVKR